VGRGSGSDTVVKRKFPAPAGTRTPDNQLVTYVYTTELSLPAWRKKFGLSRDVTPILVLFT
jgi:hypothetical protein